MVGPWWWSNGQHPCLLLRLSEFESCWLLNNFLFKKTKINEKRKDWPTLKNFSMVVAAWRAKPTVSIFYLFRVNLLLRFSVSVLMKVWDGRKKRTLASLSWINTAWIKKYFRTADAKVTWRLFFSQNKDEYLFLSSRDPSREDSNSERWTKLTRLALLNVAVNVFITYIKNQNAS